jgi:type I restriction enzyme S subunit
MVTGGDIPVYGGNGVAGSHDQSNLSGDQIVIGRVGAKCGNVRFVSGEIWLTDNAFHISTYLKAFDPAFLARLLNHKNLRLTANQAAQPVISYTTIKDLVLSFPSDVDEQRRIANLLDELDGRIQELGAYNKRKLAALDELKQSLLHQAFSGQL